MTDLRLEALVAARPERVFAAFVDGEHLREWWGPNGFLVTEVELDAAEGAGYRLTLQPPEGEAFHIRGTFRTVDPPRRLAYTFVYEEPDPDDQETLVTLSFEPSDAGTRVLLDQGPFKTPPRSELHRVGWTETLERLARALA